MISRIITSLVLSLPLIGAYGIFAIGIVLIYRASRMLNLAHGAMAMVPAFAVYSLVEAGIPMPIAFVLGIALGAGLGVGVEKLFVSRLRGDGPTSQTVGTVAALGILVAVAARFWGTSGRPAVRVFPQGEVSVGLSSIQYGEIGLFIVMLVVSAVLFVLLQRTDLGLMMRGTAESRLAASLMGVNPSLVTAFTWALGGALAGLAGILLAAVTTLHPYTLALQVLPAFIAALLGGLGSLPGALIGAVIVGATQGLVPIMGPIGKVQGAPQLFLAILAIVVMAVRGRSIVGAEPTDDEARASASKDDEEEERPVATPRSRRRRRIYALALVAGIAALPFSGVSESVIGSANLGATYTVVAVSIVLLTGWVGQISLGHAALVGIGGYATGHIVGGLGIPFPLSLPFAALATGAVAALLGMVALRVRGLYLAVATLVFSWMASEFLFRQDWFTRHSSIPSRPIGIEGHLPYFDFGNRRTFYLVAWAVALLVVFAAANLRDSKTGRAFFAVRGSEIAAASLGIHVMRHKLLAFALSGAVAGIAGNLMITDARTITSDQFGFNASLFFLALAVVGGLRSLGGAVASGILFAGLTEVFFRVEALGRSLEIVSSLLLAVVLIAYRGGLASFPARARRLARRVLAGTRPHVERVRRRFASEQEAEDEGPVPVVVTVSKRSAAATAEGGAAQDEGGEEQGLPLWRRWLPGGRAKETAGGQAPLDFGAALEHAAAPVAKVVEPVAGEGIGKDELAGARAALARIRPTGKRNTRELVIAAEHITVRFGGLTAVNDASLEVRRGEIVGLIGPNGAGKTTLFNAIAGLNSPAEGRITLFGKDATALPVHERAQLGVARTFQALQLFGDLTVYNNLLVGTHVHNPTGPFSHIAITQRSLEHERTARDRVTQVMELLDLGDIAHRRAGDLPFGVLRMVEVARALVTGFPAIMLDEPASGLDNNETDRLTEILRFVRGLGVTLLLIEHDVRMVTSVSDYMYVLDQGQIIADGTPDVVQRNSAVIAAYLGEPAKEAVA